MKASKDSWSGDAVGGFDTSIVPGKYSIDGLGRVIRLRCRDSRMRRHQRDYDEARHALSIRQGLNPLHPLHPLQHSVVDIRRPRPACRAERTQTSIAGRRPVAARHDGQQAVPSTFARALAGLPLSQGREGGTLAATA